MQTIWIVVHLFKEKENGGKLFLLSVFKFLEKNTVILVLMLLSTRSEQLYSNPHLYKNTKVVVVSANYFTEFVCFIFLGKRFYNVIQLVNLTNIYF